jgi:hypothetical protein
VDPSNLLNVVSAVTRGLALPWTQLREYWAKNPICDVDNFHLLVSAWPGALQVRMCVTLLQSGLLLDRVSGV